MSINTTINMIKRFAMFEWKSKSVISILQIWFEVIKKYYLY